MSIRWIDREYRKLTKVGNSCMVVLPPRYLYRLKLQVGELVELRATKKAIILKKAKERA